MDLLFYALSFSSLLCASSENESKTTSIVDALYYFLSDNGIYIVPTSRLVRLTSPSLNYVIAIGIIMFNIGGMMFIQPQVPFTVLKFFCAVS